MDLGTALNYWVNADDPDELQQIRLGLTTLPGTLSRSQLAERYAEKSGQDISDLMFATPGAKTPHEVFYHYDGANRLMALRSGKWKLMFPQSYNSPIPGEGGIPGKGQRKNLQLSLFDLDRDIGETNNVASEHPDVVARLQGYAKVMRKELGDGKENVGTARRQVGR